MQAVYVYTVCVLDFLYMLKVHAISASAVTFNIFWWHWGQFWHEFINHKIKTKTLLIQIIRDLHWLLIFKAPQWNCVDPQRCSFQPITSKSTRQASDPPTLALCGLLTAGPLLTELEATRLTWIYPLRPRATHQPTDARVEQAPRGAAAFSDTASVLLVASWRTLASRRPRGRRCAPLTRPSPSPSPSWGREAEFGRMEKSSSCPEICRVRYRPNARAPTQRESFWLVGARMQRRSSSSMLCWGSRLPFCKDFRTLLSLFTERCVLTQVQCSRACVRTSLGHKVTASSGPPMAARTSLFISQSEYNFSHPGNCFCRQKCWLHFPQKYSKKQKFFTARPDFSFSIEGEYVPVEGDEVTYKVSRIPPKNLKVQAVEVKITHLNPGTKHETWSGQIISS